MTLDRYRRWPYCTGTATLKEADVEPYLVLADKHVNGRREGLAFSALPDAPILAPTAPRLLRRQVTRLARWALVRPPARAGTGRAVCGPAATDWPHRNGSPAPVKSVSAVVPGGCGL